jgi:type II secretory pathway predicted ATPase ExeA
VKKQNAQAQTALQFFGYRYPPFADTFEVHEPYRCAAEDLMLERTDALLRQGKSLALHGEAGTGKSMFVKNMVSRLDSKEFRVALIPFGGLKPPAILRDLCDEFDIDTAGRKNHLSRLSADFQRRTDKPFPVIVVDEAHELQRQSLLDLCSLLHDARQRTAAAAVVLVGQPMLRKMLELDIFASVRTRLACMFTMPRLTLDDAKEFIDFRLKLAQADPGLFDDDAVECLAADIKGNRRMLMNVAALCLEEAARRKDKVVTSEIVNYVGLEFQL